MNGTLFHMVPIELYVPYGAKNDMVPNILPYGTTMDPDRPHIVFEPF